MKSREGSGCPKTIIHGAAVSPGLTQDSDADLLPELSHDCAHSLFSKNPFNAKSNPGHPEHTLNHPNSSANPRPVDIGGGGRSRLPLFLGSGMDLLVLLTLPSHFCFSQSRHRKFLAFRLSHRRRRNHPHCDIRQRPPSCPSPT